MEKSWKSRNQKPTTSRGKENKAQAMNRKKGNKSNAGGYDGNTTAAGSSAGRFVDDKSQNLNLVLDLDNTLIHAMEVPNKLTLKDKDYNKLKKTLGDDLHDILGGTVVVKLRPGVRAFLKEASVLFDLSIFTTARRAYAQDVARILDQSGNGSWFKTVVSKDDVPNGVQKGLDRLGCYERHSLVVDDIVDVWRQVDRDNLINLVPYNFFPKKMVSWPKLRDGEGEDDNELVRVLGVLKAVHRLFYRRKDAFAGNDVRPILKTLLSAGSVYDETAQDDAEFSADYRACADGAA